VDGVNAPEIRLIFALDAPAGAALLPWAP